MTSSPYTPVKMWRPLKIFFAMLCCPIVVSLIGTFLLSLFDLSKGDASFVNFWIISTFTSYTFVFTYGLIVIVIFELIKARSCIVYALMGAFPFLIISAGIYRDAPYNFLLFITLYGTATSLAIWFFGIRKRKTQQEKKEKIYTSPPKIPGTIYKGISSYQEIFLLLFLAMSCLVFLDSHLKIVAPLSLLAVTFLVWTTIPVRPRNVYIDHSFIRVDYGRGKTIDVPLINFLLYIHAETTLRGSSNYTYSVSLKTKSPQNKILTARLLSKAIPHMITTFAVTIPLRKRILTPTNLKEYVESLQEQFNCPLEILFESNKILEEYMSGKFIQK